MGTQRIYACKLLRKPQILLHILLILNQCNSQETNTPSLRIVGGSTTTISSVPYLVNIRANGIFICGGTLVTETHVVTAAHCVQGLGANSITVTGGATYLSETGIRRGVQKIIISRSYRKQTMDSDVAVLKLSQGMRGKDIETIGLCNSNWTVGQLVKVSGWGQTKEANSPASNTVRSIMVPLISHSTCERQYRNVAKITNTMFCAAEPGVKDACTGDSGGPVIFKGQLCGIVSWGVGCARKNYPGIYTNVKKVKAFIQQAISK